MAQVNTVLIGDSNQGRFELVKEIIEDVFVGTVSHARSFDEVQDKKIDFDPKFILIAHDLPHNRRTSAILLSHYFCSLADSSFGIKLGCLTENHNPELGVVPQPPIFIHVPTPLPLTTGQREQIIIELSSVLTLAPKSPRVVLEDSPSLREQVRGLSIDRELDKGNKILAELTRRMFECDELEIKSLGQGLSGASVFYLCPSKDGDKIGEFVLKLSSTDDFWKLESEVQKYQEAREVLEIKGYKKHYAEIQPALLPMDNQQFIVNYLSWFAVCYDFLGDERFQRLIDLETALVTSAAKLVEKTEKTNFQITSSGETAIKECRFHIWETALDWLLKTWYQNREFVDRQVLKVWETGDSPPRRYIPFPPYQLAGKSKSLILGFLDSKAAILGERLWNTWEEDRRRVWNFFELSELSGNTRVKLLDEEIPFILSPAHGDLNANNLLLWLDEVNYPFLIDFPFFQFSGHALQDFARLEVEIKLALMDRQLDSDKRLLPVFDNTHGQLFLWKEMEDHLLSGKWQEQKTTWAASGYKNNVSNSLELIQIIRKKAFAIQQQDLGGSVIAPVEFLNEYFPALLFHTGRAIGYSNLPIFKRLLAIYSTAKLLANPVLVGTTG